MGRLAWPALLLLAAASLALAACDEDGPSAPRGTATPEGTPVPGRTATNDGSENPDAGIGSYDDPNDFRSFGQRLANAIESQDAQFFLDSVTFADLSCINEFTAPPACSSLLDPRCDKDGPGFDPDFQSTASLEDCYPPGAAVEGIVVGVWQSEGFGLDAAAYEEFIREFLTTFDSAASDDYGGSQPRLYAYAMYRPEFQRPDAAEAVDAIATRIISSSPEPGFPPPGRSVLSFEARFDGEQWRITAMRIGGDPVTVAQHLDPSSPQAEADGAVPLFQFWGPWEDQP